MKHVSDRSHSELRLFSAIDSSDASMLYRRAIEINSFIGVQFAIVANQSALIAMSSISFSPMKSAHASLVPW